MTVPLSAASPRREIARRFGIFRDGRLQAGIVLTPAAAEDMARSLMRRAEYARLSEGTDR